MAVKNKGSIRIHEANFLKPEEINQLTSESYVLWKLKEAGAPVRGTVYLRREDGFKWTHEFNQVTQEHVYSWEKL
jgi:hypothetical protein